jgi:hypothetical protein
MDKKYKDIEEAVKDYNEYHGAASIMIDKSNGDIWTDKFISNNEFKQYHSNDVKLIYSKNNIFDKDNTISITKVELIANTIMTKDYSSYGEMINDIAEELYHMN